MFSNRRCDRRGFVKYSAAVAACAAMTLAWPGSRLGERAMALIPVGRRKPLTRTIVSMGTYVTLSLFGDGRDDGAIIDRAFEEIRRVDELMSSFSAGSEVARINRHAGDRAVQADPAALKVIGAARSVSEMSHGAFDITVLPLLAVYGFRDRRPRLPTEAEVEAARSLVDYRSVLVDPVGGRVGIERRGQRIDLGGIAKGYAVDRAVHVLKACGVERAIVNAGGDIYALGCPVGAEGWKIGIQHPCMPRRVAAVFHVSDQAVATSGNYENTLSIHGERIGHLFDPRSGRPAGGILSTTVVAPSAMEADGLATASFLMTEEDSRSLMESQAGTSALRISSPAAGALTMSATKGFPSYSA